MNSTHVAVGTTTALIAQVIVYLSHWPLQPVDLDTATSIAGLLVAGAAGVIKFYNMKVAKP